MKIYDVHRGWRVLKNVGLARGGMSTLGGWGGGWGGAGGGGWTVGVRAPLLGGLDPSRRRSCLGIR